ncbi:MAG: hypothetical protein L0Z62_46425 [Gemmataceae bacterium]|nr:hypothetical protein [Gemmataceae bacterium]
MTVLTAQEDGADLFSDPELLDRATSLGYVLFSRDVDFLVEAARRQHAGEAFAGVVYAAQLDVSIGQCVDDLELLAKVYDPPDMMNRVEYLPL